MASRTVYTSTITVPVYASWKCEECGEVNFATGAIVCKRQESSSSWRPSKQQEAEERAAAQAREEWAGDAYKIISDPNHSGHAMYSNFFLQNTKCTKCGKKPRWNKNAKFIPIIGLVMTVGLISGIAAFAEPTSVIAWLIFIACVSFIAWGIIREEVYNKMMIKLPTNSIPVIGSLNEELIDYAAKLGKKIPNPDECIAIVKGYDQVATPVTPKVQPVAESSSSENTTTVQSNFCRKCGAQLQADSGFCHKCGTEIVK